MTFPQIDWAVVAATFLGPIFAVMLTLWLQRRSGERYAQMEVYATMMRLRRSPTDSAFVGAYNLVPVHFHGVRKVMSRYQDFQRVINDPGWKVREALPKLVENYGVALTHLLVEMSRFLKVEIEAVDIQNGAYKPELWDTQEREQAALRDALWQVLVGNAALRVEVADSGVQRASDGQSLADLFAGPDGRG